MFSLHHRKINLRTKPFIHHLNGPESGTVRPQNMCFPPLLHLDLVQLQMHDKFLPAAVATTTVYSHVPEIVPNREHQRKVVVGEDNQILKLRSIIVVDVG